MEWKWNHIKIDGNNNLVLQDVDGNMKTIAITTFIEKFTNELKEEISLLYGRLRDKEKIEKLSDRVREQLQDELKKALDAKDDLENHITALLEEFRNKDISKTDILYQEAFSLFINGKLDEALAVLDDAKLDAKAQDVKKEQRQVAETFLLKAQLLQLTFAFEEAAKNFEKAITIFPDWQTHLTAANFYKFRNEFKKAEALYKKALLLAEKPHERAATLNNLANLQSDQNDYGAAEAGYKEALAVYRELSETNPQTYLPDVAMTLINFGIFYQAEVPDQHQSLECVTEALHIILPLIERLPFAKKYAKAAFQVVVAWGIKPEEFITQF